MPPKHVEEYLETLYDRDGRRETAGPPSAPLVRGSRPRVGWGWTGAIAAGEICLALLPGGLAFRLLGPVLGAP